jgi:hypothetical protein
MSNDDQRRNGRGPGRGEIPDIDPGDLEDAFIDDLFARAQRAREQRESQEQQPRRPAEGESEDNGEPDAD